MAIATKPVPKTSGHHKKRQAKHHRLSKPYLKSYWPYIPMLLLVGAGLFLNNFGSQQVLGASSDYSSQTLLTDTNRERQAKHQLGLTIDPQLSAAASAKASDMATRNYWSHNTPSGESPWSFVNAAGYNYSLAGENLAYGFDDASQTISGWMNSPEHRANILNAGYRNVGFGVVNSPNYLGKGPRVIVVALYAQPSISVANVSFQVDGPTPTASVQSTASITEPSTRAVSRLQLVSRGQPTWTSLALSVVSALAIVVFMVRHGLYLHRVITRSESFITHHPVFDMLIVALATLGVVMTHISGLTL